ncbi:hypothetical protein AGLY_013719 [Aphis glycines]|uniref:Uncharacterized protein n=1 Tax=Aphis glycines TaxID=307491 RepID=A0A6G0T746_APHGL|nr:hypothetical protein AGLY_013719 [Aphis glycines]
MKSQNIKIIRNYVILFLKLQINVQLYGNNTLFNTIKYKHLLFDFGSDSSFVLITSSSHFILCNINLNIHFSYLLYFFCCFGPPSTITTLQSLHKITQPVINSCLLLVSILYFFDGLLRSFILKYINILNLHIIIPITLISKLPIYSNLDLELLQFPILSSIYDFNTLGSAGGSKPSLIFSCSSFHNTGIKTGFNGSAENDLHYFNNLLNNVYLISPKDMVYFYFIVLLGGLICNGCSTKCDILLLLS